MACAPRDDTDQPGHPPSLIRVFAVCMRKAWVLSYPLSAQRRHWSDWADAKADQSLRWAHSHFAGFAMRRLIFSFCGMCLQILFSPAFPLLIQTLVWCKCFNMFFFSLCPFSFQAFVNWFAELSKMFWNMLFCFHCCHYVSANFDWFRHPLYSHFLKLMLWPYACVPCTCFFASLFSHRNILSCILDRD